MKKILRISGVICLCVFLSVTAYATPKLSLDDGLGNSVIIEDGGSLDIELAPGAVTIPYTPLGIWEIGILVGFTKPITGSVNFPYLFQGLIIHSTSDTGGTLTIMFTDTDFVLMDSLGFLADYGATSYDGTFQFETFVDTTNSEFGMNTPLTSSGVLGPGALGARELTPLVSAGGPYSFTLVTEITHSPGDNRFTGFDGHLFAIPEPSSMLLFCTGLLGLAAFRRRRFRK